jgi:alkanesulfonate monooxygenase SsuD/methylene tetrahydromethanopterin reductase-like flavin-dependent oxidoreductase (luciferase family)
VGRGSIPTQFYGFGIPVAENRARFDEALDIIRLAWSGERFSYAGKFYQVDNLAVVPRPLQQPHPPLRVAVHTAESFAYIGDRGFPIYSGTTTTPLPQLREGMAIYRAHLQAHGHPWRQDQAALMLPVHLAKTSTAARAAMRAGVERYYRNLIAVLSQLPDTYGDHLPRLRSLQQTVESLPFERFCQENGVFGDTRECIDRLQAARDDFGLSQIICWFDQGCMLPLAEVKRAMQHFAEEVMPHV